MAKVVLVNDADRNGALDGLRGLAVIGVLLFHDGRLSGGFLGVDLFFALSGFLITTLILREIDKTATIDIWKFWQRRFRRLLPAVLLLLVLIGPLMYVWGTVAQYDSAKHSIIPALLYFANWHEIRQGSDYWALFADPAPLTHLWSLAVEQQFYLVWPVVALVAARLRRWRSALAAAAVTIVVASGALSAVLFDPGNPTRTYEGTDTRASSILLGALAAIIGLPALFDRFSPQGTVWTHPRRLTLELMQWGLAAGLAWAWCTVDGGSGRTLAYGGFVLHATAGAILAASLLHHTPTTLGRMLRVAPLRWAGLVSYGWYLWHWPVYIILTPTRTGWHGWQLTALRVCVSLAAAVVSYFVVELPARRSRWLHRPRLEVAALLVAAAAVVAVVVVLPSRDHAPSAFDPGSVDLYPALTTAPPTTGTGATTSPATTLPRRTIHSMFWQGDSVAYDSAPGVLAAFSAAGVQAEYHGYPGIALTPRDGVDYAASVFIEPVLAQHPDLVVFQLSTWDASQSVEVQTAAFRRFSDAVLNSGAVLVVVTQPPDDPATIAVDNRVMLQLAREAAVEHPGEIIILDAHADLWGGEYARDLNGDGIPERKLDGIHICPQGSALLGNWLVHQLAALFDGLKPAPAAEWADGDWINEKRYDDPAGTCR